MLHTSAALSEEERDSVRLAIAEQAAVISDPVEESAMRPKVPVP
jgi:hypothetical protein